MSFDPFAKPESPETELVSVEEYYKSDSDDGPLFSDEEVTDEELSDTDDEDLLPDLMIAETEEEIKAQMAREERKLKKAARRQRRQAREEERRAREEERKREREEKERIQREELERLQREQEEKERMEAFEAADNEDDSKGMDGADPPLRSDSSRKQVRLPIG